MKLRCDYGGIGRRPGGGGPCRRNNKLPHSTPKPLSLKSLRLARFPIRRGLQRASVALQTIQRALGARATLLDHVRVSHRSRDIIVTQQLLNGTNVRAPLKEGCGEAVPKRV